MSGPGFDENRLADLLMFDHKQQMVSVFEDSTSYPFLWLSIKYEVPYGQVLSYVDYVTKTSNPRYPRRDLTYWEMEAWEASTNWAWNVINAITEEIGRQREISAGRKRFDEP